MKRNVLALSVAAMIATSARATQAFAGHGAALAKAQRDNGPPTPYYEPRRRKAQWKRERGQR